jgi:hypothetical protein
MCIACRQVNRTCELQHNGRQVEVDCGIAQLLNCVWQQGIETDGACEGEVTGVQFGLSVDIQAYIGFPTLADLLQFLRIAAGVGAVSQVVKYKMRGNGSAAKVLHLRNGWKVRWSTLHDGRMVDFPPDEIAAIQARFPLPVAG